MGVCTVALKAFAQAALRFQVVPTNLASRLLLDSHLEKRHVSDCAIIMYVSFIVAFSGVHVSVVATGSQV